MESDLEKKVRDLKLKIHMTEKELHSSQHTMNVGALLRAGHARQINQSATRDRKRLEEKLEQLRAKLEELAPGSSPPRPTAAAAPTTPDTSRPPTPVPAPVKKAEAAVVATKPAASVKPEPPKSSAKPAMKKAAEPKQTKKSASKKAAAGKTAAKKPVKKGGKK